jgi:hypothetical protein
MEFDLASFIGFLVQLAAGLVVIFIVYGIAVYVMNTDGIASDTGIVQAIAARTTVLPGTVDATAWRPRVWNTVLPDGAAINSSLPIRRSVNRYGGAQFTYSFWLYVDNLQNIHNNSKNNSSCTWSYIKSKKSKSSATDACPPTGSTGTTPAGDTDGPDTFTSKDKKVKFDRSDSPDLYVLFMKGDNRCFEYAVCPYDKENKKVLANETGYVGRYVKAPLIAIGNPLKREIVVSFNSLSAVDNTVVLSSNPDPYDSTARRNVPSLTEHAWVMYTFVFMDYVPINDFESGIVVKSYINDTVYQMDKFSGSLRDNDGELTVLPDGPPGTDMTYSTPGTKLLLSTMDYYNYALSDIEVRNRYTHGVNQNPNPDVKVDNDRPILDLSAYNKLDVYNL